MELIFLFVFLYPLFMAIFWMIGAILFFRRREAGDADFMVLEHCPPVAILVPCHNEEENIRDTINQLARNTYADFEIIAINDGSTDATGRILEELAQTIGRLRVITLVRNLGKAMALRAGAMASRAEFLMCVDADALLEPDALHWMMPHFVQGARVAAVTGNPRVHNKRGLLSRIQVGEFSAIVGMVKRGQRDIGRIFTVSGVHVCFRRRALHDVGYWSPETVTEDIDISWKLQLRYWDIRYEPRALTWIVVPETLKGLWRQRLRWARGGVEAAIKHAHLFKSWSLRRMWPVYTEYILGAAWCYAWAATVVFWIMTQLLPDTWPQSLAVQSILPKWTGVILGVTCLLQFTVGLYLDSHYEKGIFRSMFWAIWYPALYWMLSGLATIVAIPQALYYRDKILYATWKSPERKAHP